MRAILRIVIVLLSLLILAALALGAWILVQSMDEPPPDDSDLIVAVTAVPASENGLEVIKALPPLDLDGIEALGLYDLEADGPEAEEPGQEAKWDDAVARGILERNAAALEALDRALAMPSFREAPGMSPSQGSPYSESVDLTDLLRLRAMTSWREGRAGDAVKAVMDLATLGRAFRHCGGTWPELSLGVYAQDSAWQLLLRLTPQDRAQAQALRGAISSLRAHSCSGETLGECLRDYYTTCVQLLDDVAAGRKEAEVLWQGFYCGPRALETADSILGGRNLLRPNETRRILAEETRKVLEDLRKPAAQRQVRQIPATWLLANPLGVAAAQHFLSFALAFVRRQELSEARLRATRAILALRCRALETNALPDSLDALVPDLLEAVPTDPFDGKPLRYSRERKIVWSVGSDLKDSGGQRLDAATDWWVPPFEEEPTFRVDP